jgi:hypothetical protein
MQPTQCHALRFKLPAYTVAGILVIGTEIDKPEIGTLPLTVALASTFEFRESKFGHGLTVSS